MSNEKLRSAFKAFDADDDGTITANELLAILTRQGGGAAMSEADAAEVIKVFDTNGDGVLDVGEFIEMITADNGSDKVGKISKAVEALAQEPAFELSTPMLVMPFNTFKAQGRINKSVKTWREPAIKDGRLVEYVKVKGGSGTLIDGVLNGKVEILLKGKIVIFISCAPRDLRILVS